MKYSINKTSYKPILSITVLMLISIVTVNNAFSLENQDLLPLQENVHYIDRDGDGYGVAAPKGPDADDNDPHVNTYESAIAKYGSLEKLLNHLGYYPTRIFYNETKPSTYQPGDMVIYRAGEYQKVTLPNETSGTAEKPVVMLAMPGERVVLHHSYSAISGNSSTQHIVFDGFEIDGKKTAYVGVDIHFVHDITLKNLFVHDVDKWGIRGFQDFKNVLIEDSVVRDTVQEHGIYLGSRDYPGSNVIIRGSRLYGNGRHGFQWNGRVTNLTLEENIIHSNNLGGVSLINGVSDSIVKNNLIFNNNKQGIIFYDYDDSNSSILPYDQNNNLVENNIIWGGKYSWNGKDNPNYYAAILFNDATAQQIQMDNNVIRHNILITHSDAVLRFQQQRIFDTTTIENNLIYKPERQNQILDLAGTDYDFEGFQNSSSRISENMFEDPHFQDVSVDYYKTPEKFNFTMSSLQTYAITASSGEGGTITPAGTISISAGANQDFTIVPETGYQIKDVFVDSISQGTINSYTFANVQADHTIQASFEVLPPITYTIAASAGSGGSISPAGSVNVEEGNAQSFTITPDTGYQVKDVVVDDASRGAVSSYTFSNVQADHTIQAAFEALPPTTYTIDASAGSGGSISPAGVVSVEEGSAQSFTITPDAGYQVQDVVVDGASQGAISSYTFENVQADHTIQVSFEEVLPLTAYTIDVIGSSGGSISLASSVEKSIAPIMQSDAQSFSITSDGGYTVTVTKGHDQRFNITPRAGYQVKDVLVDGGSQGAVVSYTFTHVQANHTIQALFEEILPPTSEFDEIGFELVNDGKTISSGFIASDFFASDPSLLISDGISGFVNSLTFDRNIVNTNFQYFSRMLSGYDVDWLTKHQLLTMALTFPTNEDAVFEEIVTNAEPVTAYFKEPDQSTLSDGVSDAVLAQAAEPVPEPSTLLLLGIGSLGMFALMRKKLRKEK